MLFFRNVPSTRRTPAMWAGRVKRRGTALILVLLMTVTLAAIAMSAILLTGSGGMIGRYYDRERDFRYAAEASLQMGKARLTRDTTIHLPDTGFVTLVSGGQIKGADGLVIPNVKVNLYAGYTNITTGQFGQYASVVAEAYDAGGTRYVRRLEMQAENFARYAMFTNTFSSGLCYGTGEFIAGRAHSNQGWYSCNSPIYKDTVSAVLSVTGGSPTYMKGKINGAPYIPIPPVGKLASLHTHAVEGNLDVIALGNDLSSARTRIEFTAVDLNGDDDITDPNEGFLRVYQASGPAATSARMKSDLQFGASGAAAEDSLCGDFHTDTTGHATFYPIWVHNQPWFASGRVFTAGQWALVNDEFTSSITAAKRQAIMNNPTFRCYMGGDPHLVASERRLMLPAPPTNVNLYQKGGEDSTLTDSTKYGFWQGWSGNQAPVVTALNGTAGTKYQEWRNHASTLWPLYRSLNPNTKGVIHVHGPVVMSGVLRGSVTVYAATTGSQSGQVGYGDDLVYAQDPAAVLCANLLGVISDGDQMILDNSINSPQRASGSGGSWEWTDGDDNGMSTSHDFVLHGVTMSRLGTIGVENYGSHPEGIGRCNGANTGRGCIRQAGGVIEQVISATWAEQWWRLRRKPIRRRLPQHAIAALLPHDGPLHRQSLLRDRSGALQHHDVLPEPAGRLLTRLAQSSVAVTGHRGAPALSGARFALGLRTLCQLGQRRRLGSRSAIPAYCRMRIAILTISDAGARGDRKVDGSGDAIAEWVRQRHDTIVDRALVPDDVSGIVAQLIAWCDADVADLVLTTGGTGLAPRDLTPEATRVVLEREAPGIAERIRVLSVASFPRAALSRGLAGVRGRTLIINLPGSTSGVRDGLAAIDPIIEHAVRITRGVDTHHEREQAK